MRDPLVLDIGDLYIRHWQYVLALLPTYGIPGQDAEDVAQTVWMHVHRRRDSYHAATHKTPRAWLTGFVERCAANHRRAARRHAARPAEAPGDLLPAPGPDPEQATILRELHRLIPNDEQRVALLLQVRHGLSIAEIAAVQGVTESAVEWRLHMARKALANDDEGKVHCAFLGFGSLEKLAEALQPKPIPPEVGERMWQRIAERIRQEDGSPSDTDPPPPSLPPAAAVPAVALPALVPPAVPVLVTLGKGTLASLLAVVLVGGITYSAGGVVALQAHEESHGRAAIAAEACPGASAAPSTTPRSAATPGTSAPSTAPSTSAPSTAPRSTAAPSTTAPSAAPSAASSSTTTPSAGETQRLLARMREAMHERRFSEVLTLAEQHARQFAATHVQQREALRIEALRQTGRAKDAEQHARAVAAAHPEHRRAMERAAGLALR